MLIGYELWIQRTVYILDNVPNGLVLLEWFLYFVYIIYLVYEKSTWKGFTMAFMDLDNFEFDVNLWDSPQHRNVEYRWVINLWDVLFKTNWIFDSQYRIVGQSIRFTAKVTFLLVY